MKRKVLFITLFIVSLHLNGRENPFNATKAYKEEVQRLMEIKDNYPNEFDSREKIYIEEMKNKIKNNDINKNSKNTHKKDLKQPSLTEEKVKKLINQAQEKSVKETQKMLKQLKEKKKEKIIYVKPRNDISFSKEPLPFLKLEYTNDKIEIHSQYEVFKKFTLPNENKIILDFYGQKEFYTKRVPLNSSNFKRITIGNHKKEKFFRVVIELTNTPDNYEVTYGDELVSIVALERM